MEKFSELGKGLKRNENVTWSSQLSDKYQGVTNLSYYSIMYCGNEVDTQRSGLDSMVTSYLGNQDDCRLSSPCNRNPNYVLSRSLLTDPFAIQLLEKWLHKTYLYTKVEKCSLGMSTFYTESCCSALRSFCPKGQRYGFANYEMRSNIFLLDWNVGKKCSKGHRL